MTIETERPDIVSIQVMRAVAALLVVMVHVDLQLDRLGYGAMGWGWGARGVDVFFVISGFIMWVSVARRPSTTPQQFLRRRIERIVPLYWALTAFVVGVALVSPTLLKTTRLDGWHTAASFLFIPAEHPNGGMFWPVVVPGWTLNFEMLFYALFAAAIGISRGSERVLAAATTLLIGGFLFLCIALQGPIPGLSFYARLLLLEFLAGIGLAIAYLRLEVTPHRAWIAVLGAGFVLLWAAPQSDAVGLAGATLVVAGALFSRLPPIPGLRALGDASYSLYLTQVLSLPAAGLLWRLVGAQALDGALFALFAVAVAIAFAMLSYHLFERPITQWFADRDRARTREPQQSALRSAPE